MDREMEHFSKSPRRGPRNKEMLLAAFISLWPAAIIISALQERETSDVSKIQNIHYDRISETLQESESSLIPSSQIEEVSEERAFTSEASSRPTIQTQERRTEEIASSPSTGVSKLIHERFANGEEIFDFLCEAKKTFSEAQLQELIIALVETTDEKSNPLPAGSSLDEYRNRQQTINRWAESFISSELLENQALLGIFLTEARKMEQAEAFTFRRTYGSEPETAPTHDLRGAMLGRLLEDLERKTFSSRPGRAFPTQIIESLREKLDLAQKLGANPEEIRRYADRINMMS